MEKVNIEKPTEEVARFLATARYTTGHHGGHVVPASVIFDDFAEWCIEYGAFLMSSTMLGRSLRTLGYENITMRFEGKTQKCWRPLIKNGELDIERKPRIRLTDTERFFSKVIKCAVAYHGNEEIGPCWNWVGTYVRDIGTFRVCKMNMAAHRYSYQYHVAPILDRFIVRQVCGNYKCVNPAHLQCVTRDYARHWKLDEVAIEQIIDMQRRRFRVSDIAEKFNVSVSLIYSILKELPK